MTSRLDDGCCHRQLGKATTQAFQPVYVGLPHPKVPAPVVRKHQEAGDLMERLLTIASPLGLYAEEFDVTTGRHLGNFPQAFSHLALLEAAARIIIPERLAEH
jgi:hypothetical protein